jgi:dipeptidyl aminopeptidase/acylaminoacyl peptidase
MWPFDLSGWRALALLRLTMRLFALAAVWPSVASGQHKRPMGVDDLFALEQMSTVTASPDGEWLAVVIARARTSAEKYQRYASADDVDHSDVWLVPRRGGERRNITNGFADGSGYWNPVWSPDGKRLAMLATKGAHRGRAFVYLWERATDTLRQLTGRGVDLGAYGDKNFVTYGMLWSDSTTLLCPVEPDDALPMGYQVMSFPFTKAATEWAKARRGLEPAVSVLESGRELNESERPTGQLLALDVVSARSRPVADGNFRQLLVSPTRRHLALIAETGRIPPRPDRRIAYGDRFRELWRTRLLLLSLDDGLKIVRVDSVIDPKLMGGDTPHSWSPDGSSLAVIGKEHRDDQTATGLWVVSALSGAARRVTTSALEVSASAWSSGGQLLALASSRSSYGTNGNSRFDWWAINRKAPDPARKLTAQLKVVPASLSPTPSRNVMLGIAAGDLWSIDARTGAAKNVTHGFEPEIQEEAWPTGIQRKARYRTERIVRTRDQDLYGIEWADSAVRLRPVPHPSTAASLVEYRAEQRLTAFTGIKPDGTFLWTGDGRSDRFEQRIALNGQVAQIADARRMLIEYRGTDGDRLSGLLLLPVGYEQGKRYPLVTWVHPGRVVSDTTSFFFVYDKQSVSSLNVYPLISRGYALLIPSMPMPPDGDTGEPYLTLAKGVMAAVDKVVDIGIADPDRLALMGHSFGGYAVYSLVTHTNRFRVAVSFAGPANLFSAYGTLWPGQRYYDFAHEELFHPALSESGQVLMGNTPWGDLSRYVRNSPVYFADRVQTPLMIVQGDLDYVPIQQGEEFFTGLYRLGKKAKFVRYWGEGHTIETPVNTRDMWQRIFRWFDEHLRADEGVTEN